MAKSPSRARSPHALYTLRWYDYQWDEMTSLTQELVTAAVMIESIERWNRKTQLESRSPAIVVPDCDNPTTLEVEVHYV